MREARRHWLASACLALLCLLLPSCGGDGESVEYNSPVVFLSMENREGFERVEDVREFSFPRDHGGHERTQIEWWYFTGNLSAKKPAPRELGFELTLFRVGLAPEEEGARESKWATRQLYLAHFAVTDVDGARFFAFERLTREGLGLAGWQLEPFRVWNEGWSISAPAGDDIWPMRLQASDRDREVGRVAVDLELTPQKPLVLQGDRGFSAKGPEPGNASYYLQFPRILAKGSVQIGAEGFEVEGLTWMDHEWSTSVLSPELAGWDWFALQLDDGRDVMVYQLRRRDGSAAAESEGSIVDKDGRITRLPYGTFELSVTRRWTSPKTGVEYPAGWTLKIPGHDVDLAVTPALDDQELRLTTTYWEGAVRVTSAERPLGKGYVELVGYEPTDDRGGPKN